MDSSTTLLRTGHRTVNSAVHFCKRYISHGCMGAAFRENAVVVMHDGFMLRGESTSRRASQAGGQQRMGRHWPPTSLFRRARGEVANSKLLSPPSDSDGGEIWFRIARCTSQQPALRDAGDRPARGRVASFLHLRAASLFSLVRHGHSRAFARAFAAHFTRHSWAFAGIRGIRSRLPLWRIIENLRFSYVSPFQARHEKSREQPPFKTVSYTHLTLPTKRIV